MSKAFKKTGKKFNLDSKRIQKRTIPKVLFKTSFVESRMNPILAQILVTVLVVGRVLFWLSPFILFLIFKTKLFSVAGFSLVSYLLNRFK